MTDNDVIEPPAPRATVSEENGGLRISIPCVRSWFAVVFLTGWLIAWAVFEVLITREIFTARIPLHMRVFMIGFLLAWTAGGLAAVWALLRSVGGRELVEIDATTLTIWSKTWLFARRRAFALGAIQDLRVDTGLRFDYGARTYTFGSSLDEAELKQLYSRIIIRYPSVAPKEEA